MRMTKLGRLFALAVVLTALAGCSANTALTQKHLRVTQPADCRDSVGKHDGLTVSLKLLDSLPNLDRSAVLFERDHVLQQSDIWYWEGPAPRLLAQSLQYGLTCGSTIRVLTPYRPRLQVDLVLSGELLAFNVVRNGRDEFVLAYHLEAWDGESGAYVGGKSFDLREPLSGLTAEVVAAAASRALGQSVDEVAAWLDGLPR